MAEFTQQARSFLVVEQKHTHSCLMRSGWKVEHNIIAQIRELLSVYIENWTLPTARDFVDVGVLCTLAINRCSSWDF